MAKKKSTKKKTKATKTTKKKVAAKKDEHSFDLYCYHCGKTSKANRADVKPTKQATGKFKHGEKIYNKMIWFVCPCSICNKNTAGQFRENEE